MPCEISHRTVIVVAVRPEIPPLLRDNLILSFPLQLVFFHFFVFVNPVHKLTYAGDRLVSQGFPQVVLSWETAFKSADGNVIKVAVHLIIHFPISIEYAFRVSPSHMDNGNNELKGRGTMLFVMKREPKA